MIDRAIYPGIRYSPDAECWVTTSELDVWVDGERWRVPAGTHTDGASIPQACWSIIGHPLHEDIYPAAVLHDYLYRTGRVSRERADWIFVVFLARLGVSHAKREAMYQAVRAFGGDAYRG